MYKILIVLISISVINLQAQDKPPKEFSFGESIQAPKQALSWYSQGNIEDLSQRWEALVVAIAQQGPKAALADLPEDIKFFDQDIYAEASHLLHDGFQAINRVLDYEIANRPDLFCTNGQDWELELRLHAGLFPAAYVVSETCDLFFQIPLPSYEGIFKRLEAAANFYTFGTTDNPTQSSHYFDGEGNEMKPG